MKCCEGVWRKLVIIPLVVLVVGWIANLVGFSLMITSDESATRSRFDFLPHYIAVGSPPVLVLLASLHAALFGLPSSILGLFTALLSVFCFTAVGYVLYGNAVLIYGYAHGFQFIASLSAQVYLMFIGSTLMSLSWVFVLVSWNCFRYKDVGVGEEDYVVDEEGTMDPPPRVPKEPPYFAGVARKLVAVLLVFQFGCWCLFIAGVDLQLNFFPNFSSQPSLGVGELELPLDFDTLAVSTVGVLLVISAFIHAASRGTSSPQIGAFTYILSMLYLTTAGHLFFAVAIIIYHQCVDSQCTITNFPKYQVYQLSGVFGTCIFWACVLALRPFYFRSKDTIQDLRIRIRQQRRYLFQNQRSEDIPLFYQSTGSTPAPSAPPL